MAQRDYGRLEQALATAPPHQLRVVPAQGGAGGAGGGEQHVAAAFGLQEYGAVMAALEAAQAAMKAADMPIRLRGLPDFPQQVTPPPRCICTARACALHVHVHRMDTACAPHVHCMCTECALNVH